ncbi:uncharacterized protein F4822DRAFT_439807 [Hypoxylon trugodes]|uniref:uncharacterized protein n=1 Tax=Hypoxylon trugodes TaxID=326681 RepID=UPI002196F2D8|nr:uncharacterized protein F4822DRAFT_439807 [Hypoxylon trugodes]KAI1393973.1 hypothetical protein F4822DRAFT_439807 [Hypoxylon trugodes]
MGWKCNTCKREFAHWRSRDQHVDALGHQPLDFDCRGNGCNDCFSNSSDRRDHEAKTHSYCSDCQKSCGNPNNLRMHLNSRIHRGSSIQCPFCKTNYATATGLAHHLEGGRCSKASFLNRDQIYKAVRAKDPTGMISKKLIGWHGSTTYEATDKAWNGWAWECYLCNRTFNAKPGLDQHLQSPIHQQALYHCPDRNGCGREFKTLAAVMNHLESESCGYTRFENVQKSVSNIVSGDRRLTFI